MAVYEFITIEPAGTSPSGKTSIFQVRNMRSDDLLGLVKWYGPWRQYVFVAAPMTLYSRGCLRDIADFLDSLRGAR